MKTKIKEVQDYFAQKIYNCEFEVIETSHPTVKIKVEGYLFELWVSVSNGIECFATYDHGENFIGLNLKEEKSTKVFDFLVNHGKPTTEEEKAEKVALIAKLTKELENL